jgi:hypothetical protein
MAFVREEGSGPVEFNSPVDGAPVTLVSWKQVSSTCVVWKPEFGTGTPPSVDVKMEHH